MYKPVESVDISGFFEIPNFPRYLISPFGEIYDKEKKEYIQARTFGEGYYYFQLRDLNNHLRLRSRHRILAIVFKHPGRSLRGLVVNHINGIKGSDDLSNLEWLTILENQEHAGWLGISTKSVPVQVRDVKTGTVRTFASAKKCAKALKVTKDFVLYRINNFPERVFVDLKQYRRFAGEKPWYQPTEHELENILEGMKRAVLVRDVLLGEIKRFESLTDFAEYIGLSMAGASKWLSKEGQPVLPGFIQVKWAYDITPWRPVVDAVLELGENINGRMVVAINEKTGEKIRYSSCRDCAKAHGIKFTALNYRLSLRGTRVFKDGYRYIYYNDLISVSK